MLPLFAAIIIKLCFMLLFYGSIFSFADSWAAVGVAAVGLLRVAAAAAAAGLVLLHQPVRGHLLHLHARRALQVAQQLHQLRLVALEGFAGVHVLHGRRLQVQPVVRREVLVVVVRRDLVIELLPEQGAGLVGPAAGDVADGVPAAPQHQQRQPVALHEPHALRVALEGEVEAAQAVAREGVRAALEHHRRRPVHLHHLGHDGLEHALVRAVVHAVPQREVQAVPLALPGPDVLDVPRAREEVPVLVEAAGHHPVRAVEGLLHAVPVVDVDVDVKNSRVVFQQLQDGQDNVVHVAEAAGLALLGVVQAAGPVHGHVAEAVVELDGPVQRAARVQLAVLEDAIENGAVRVLAHVEPLHLRGQLPGALGAHALQEGQVGLAVELEHLLSRGQVRPINIHLPVQAIG
mmetsp:Transcript_10421/g.14544  ORF Transcript_10421/g.14544 Transcript_10421/m.14544 type:complete len:404 (-) Transcript_10421:156-1367(-)